MSRVLLVELDRAPVGVLGRLVRAPLVLVGAPRGGAPRLIGLARRLLGSLRSVAGALTRLLGALERAPRILLVV